jgi:hypothetical protein
MRTFGSFVRALFSAKGASMSQLATTCPLASAASWSIPNRGACSEQGDRSALRVRCLCAGIHDQGPFTGPAGLIMFRFGTDLRPEPLVVIKLIR